MHIQPPVRKRLFVTLGAAVGGGLFAVTITWLFRDVVFPFLAHRSPDERVIGFLYYIGVLLGEPALSLDFQFGYRPFTLSPCLINGLIAGVVCGCVTAFWVFMVKPALKDLDQDENEAPDQKDSATPLPPH